MRAFGHVVFLAVAFLAAPAALAEGATALAPLTGPPDATLERQLRGLVGDRLALLPTKEGQGRMAMAERLGVFCEIADDECLVKLAVVADVDAVLVYLRDDGDVRLAVAVAQTRTVRRARGNASDDVALRRAVDVVLGEAPSVTVVDPGPDRDPVIPDPDPEPPPIVQDGPSPWLFVGGGAMALGTVGVIAGSVGVSLANATFVDETEPTASRELARSTAWASLGGAVFAGTVAAAGLVVLVIALAAPADDSDATR